MNDIELKGCTPEPLAHYLKALGVLRLVAEQKDPKARGYWKNDRFHLVTELTEKELVNFFLEEYRPTPFISPWNGGGGFYYREEKSKDKDPETGKFLKTGIRNQPTAATTIVDNLASSTHERFKGYRSTILTAKEVLSRMNIKEAPKGNDKLRLITILRNEMDDKHVSWLDSSIMLTNDDLKYPPMFGSGATDGNNDFCKNFMERISDVIKLQTGVPTGLSSSWLEDALFNLGAPNRMYGVAIGQFYPSAAGGFNSSAGFTEKSSVNPWDFILLIEGSYLFTGSSSKMLSNLKPGELSYPFSVTNVATGYGSSAKNDSSKTKAELWVPLWTKATLLSELKVLLSEGKASIGRKRVRNAIDFARSVSALGVDRGIDEFVRYGFQERFGQSTFATPLGRFQVKRQPQVDLINEIDGWLDRFRSKASSDVAPSSVTRASRNLDCAIMDLCKSKGTSRMQQVLIELGRCERALMSSEKWTMDTAYLKPVPHLSQKWINECDDNSAEFRLAVALASVYAQFGKDWVGIRRNLEAVIVPTDSRPFFKLEGNDLRNEVVPSSSNLSRLMIDIMSRRIILAQKTGSDCYPDRAVNNGTISDITDFVEGDTNDRKIMDLFFGFILVNWSTVKELKLSPRKSFGETLYPDVGYIMMKACFSQIEISGKQVPLVPQIFSKLSRGDGIGASRMAVSRLRSFGVVMPFEVMKMSRKRAERIAASLLFPIHPKNMERLLITTAKTMKKEDI